MSATPGDGAPLYGPAVGRALSYAAGQHAGQRRKGKDEPYLSHVLLVASLVTRYGGTEEQIIAGALHDVPEDCGGEPKLEEIGAMFGPDVMAIVADCTDSLVTDPDAKAPWRERKLAHLEHVRHGMRPDSALVAACDKLANLTDLASDVERSGDTVLGRFRGGAVGTRAYYAATVALLAPRIPSAAAIELETLLARLKAEPVPLGADPVVEFRRRTAQLQG